MPWINQSVLITGGTGSLGRALTAHILLQKPKRLIIFSRDELKQHEMRQQYPDSPGASIRYFIGDVRDRDRLMRAFRGVDTVIHAAALKQVPSCEYNPREPILTNVMGAMHVIDAALDCGVKRVLLVSTDKATTPINVYGKTKALAESLFVQANAYSGGKGPRFAAVRYGNVVGSRGSVIPLFQAQKATGRLTITDARMTRFWLTMPQAISLIETALTHMRGGEIYVPKIPSMKVTDLAEAIAPGCRQEFVGIRPGEKLHESLIGEDEARQGLDCGDVYLIQPAHPFWEPEAVPGTPLPDGWQYRSDMNSHWLSVSELRRLAGECHA